MYLERELLVAERLIVRAGVMAARMRDELIISHKPHGLGPVTNADLAVDKFLCAELAAAFPDDLVVSEEGDVAADTNTDTGRVWFIDPIDGTASYILGNDSYAVMMGLAIDGVARLGMIYQPSIDKLWRAVIDPDGKDSFADVVVDKSRNALTRAPTSTMPSSLTLIASPTRRSARQTAMIERLAPTRIVYKSSIGLKAMVIAEGGADFYVAWSQRIAKWDLGAPATILTAAGGLASGVDKAPLAFNNGIYHHGPVLFSGFTPDDNFFAVLSDIAKS